MNRLVLVGNGFDLAHGLKTSYKDFIFWYLAECLSNAGGHPYFYDDQFIHVRPPYINEVKSALNPDNPIHGKKNHLDFIQQHFADGTLIDFLDINPKNRYLSEPLERGIIGGNHFLVQVKNSFFGKLVYSCIACNWVDIEDKYFEALKECKNKEDGRFSSKDVKNLNDDLNFLKKKLEEYLKAHQKECKPKVNDKLVKLLNAKFEWGEFDTVVDYEELRARLGYILDGREQEKHQLYILNFNYTNTFSIYESSIGNVFPHFEINHVHGELNNPENPIIFGFGDEHDKVYTTFEEQGSNDLFTHIKSYQYFKTPNYRNLVRFLNSDNFQVYIMGHSCGLSDRTMFKEIFDHANCKSVKIFHYEKDGENDFWEKTVNLGRHFSDKGRMRKLIVEFNERNAFPQN